MSTLSHVRLIQLREDLKLPGIAESYSALASAASDGNRASPTSLNMSCWPSVTSAEPGRRPRR